MNYEFLRLYNEELLVLRKQGREFAKLYPKIAGGLCLEQSITEDPLVSRLVESFAFLTTRVRYQLKSDLDNLSEDIMNLLYPHYMLPIPSCSTLQFSIKQQIDKPYTIPSDTCLTTYIENGENCYFKSIYPVTLWPLYLSSAIYKRNSNIQSKKHDLKTVKACLSLTIKSNKSTLSISDIKPNHLRFFIKTDLHYANLIYEIFMAHVEKIVLSISDKNIKEVTIPTDIIQPVGISDKEGLFYYPPNSFIGFRLLTEFFTFPEKFLYIDLISVDKYLDKEHCDEIILHFFLDRFDPELEKIINNDTFLFGCTPVVNIFEQTGEPIFIDQKQTEYHVVPDGFVDSRNIEIYNIKSIDITSEHSDCDIVCSPWFGKKIHDQENKKCLYWKVSRKPCLDFKINDVLSREMFVSFANINYLQSVCDTIIATPKLLCMNHEVPIFSPSVNNKLKLSFFNVTHDIIKNISCVTPITAQHYRDKTKIKNIDLIKHIFLDQMDFSGDANVLDILCNILELYCYNDNNNTFIRRGLLKAEVNFVTKIHSEGLKQGFCRGAEFVLIIDEIFFPDKNCYLFGSVLNEFLSKSCSINSFVILIIKNKRHEEIYRWKPKLGAKSIL